MLGAILLSLICVGSSVILQFEGVRQLSRLGDFGRHSSVGLSVMCLIGLHLGEVIIFGVGYVVGDRLLDIGQVASSREIGVLDVFYYSAEVFSTLGLGDIYATSYLRMLTSIEALTGILLLSWSASFIFVSVARADGFAPRD